MGFSTTWTPQEFETSTKDSNRQLAISYAQAVEEALKGPASLLPVRGRIRSRLKVEVYYATGSWRIKIRMPQEAQFVLRNREIERTIANNSTAIRARVDDLQRAKLLN